MTTHQTLTPSAFTPSMVIVRRSPDAPLELRPRSRRDALIARLASSSLDARLARGVAPESGRFLAVRASQLVAPVARRSLADAWLLVLRRASQPGGVVDARVPVARAAVLAAESEITELIESLRGSAPVSARGVARARTLLTDGAGPVYHRGDLRTALADVLAAMTR